MRDVVVQPYPTGKVARSYKIFKAHILEIKMKASRPIVISINLFTTPLILTRCLYGPLGNSHILTQQLFPA